MAKSKRSKAKPMTAMEAVAMLRECDHAFIGEESIEAFNAALGVNVRGWEHRASPGELKGLTLNGGASKAVGICAADYAEAASAELGTGFHPWQSGRGFRLRSACDALEAHFKQA